LLRRGLCDLRRPVRGDALVAAAARHLDAVADADLGVGLDAVELRDFAERQAVAAADADQAFAGLHHMHIARRDGLRVRRRYGQTGRLGARSLDMRRRRLRLAHHVTRNDQALAGTDRAVHAIGLEDRLRRHTVFARDAFERVAAGDDDRRAAVPGPVTGGL